MGERKRGREGGNVNGKWRNKGSERRKGRKSGKGKR